VKKYAVLLVVLLFIVPLSCCIGDEPRIIEISYGDIDPEYDVFEVYSPQVHDTFTVYVMMPKDYDSDHSYDVVYLLDGDWYFDDTYRIDGNGVSGIVCTLCERDVIEDVILVGVGYPVGNQRGRDFAQHPDLFYRFIKYELTDVLESRYLIDDMRSRTLIGHSSAGFFSFYVLFKGDHFFDAYVAVSTPFYDASRLLFSDELSFYNRFGDERLDLRLFMAVGGDEEDRFTSAHDDMVARLEAKDYDGMALEHRIYYGRNHTSVVFDAFLDGLAWTLAGVDDVVIIE